MAPPGDYSQQSYPEQSTALEAGGRLEPKTPLRGGELVSKSTVQPSTRRVRRLDGEKLAATNPLFQPWTAESSKKVLDFSRNISPRKNDATARYCLEPVAIETTIGRRKLTRQAPSSTALNSSYHNSTLTSISLSDLDSSASYLSDIDIGDVTLPANLQLANQPTELSQRMARLRQDTCITILEDDSFASVLETESASKAEAATETVFGHQRLKSLTTFDSLSPNDSNERSGAASAMPNVLSVTRISQEMGEDGKENVATVEPSISYEKLAEQLVECQLWESDSISDEPLFAMEASSHQKPLLSPRKAPRIPQTSHTPKKDDFWKQSLVDCWNDEHSPRKAVKVAMRSPEKKGDFSKASKAAFKATKAQIASEFLRELDAEITSGSIEKLAQATGGVKIEWSKTLSTTAGRANWKRETIRTGPSDGSEVSVTYKHYASIELAEKVIDDEHKLLNVLAHEFCHLANFMVSGITNNPHGKEFKYWAARCSETFANRGINVTTKHTYEIDFKYVWQCEDCPSSYKRHSKSIDTAKHRCGGCKGKLVQIKPVPRNAGKPSEYQLFIKNEMKALKLEIPNSPQKVLMQMAAEKWVNRSENVESNVERDNVGEVAAQLLSMKLRE